MTFITLFYYFSIITITIRLILVCMTIVFFQVILIIENVKYKKEEDYYKTYSRDKTVMILNNTKFYLANYHKIFSYSTIYLLFLKK